MQEWNFTESERHAIDGAYHKMETGEDITADEMRLVIRFEQWRTANSEESRAKEETMRAESEARIEEARKTQETARLALEQMAAQAIAQYERTLKNVEEK